MIPEELTLRRLLWLRHGCPFEALYGDDGEMQCNAVGCRIDFLRATPDQIEQAFHRRGAELWQLNLQQGGIPVLLTPQVLQHIADTLEPGQVFDCDSMAFDGMPDPMYPEKGQPRNLGEIRALVRSVEGRNN